jgi:hypothetical protein
MPQLEVTRQTLESRQESLKIVQARSMPVRLGPRLAQAESQLAQPRRSGASSNACAPYRKTRSACSAASQA